MGHRTVWPVGNSAAHVRAAWLCALALAWAVTAHADVWEARAVGERPVTPTSARERAERLATLDAQVALWRTVVTRVEGAASVKALALTPKQLGAYVAGVLVLPAAERLEGASHLARMQIAVGVDLEDLAQRLEAAHQDGEAAADLMNTWQRLVRLQGLLSADASSQAPVSPAGGDTTTPTRDPLREHEVNVLLARATATLIRREGGTTSLPVIETGAVARARTLVERALTLDALNDEAHVRMTDVLLLEQEPGEAEPILRAVVRRDAGSALKHNKLGNALFAQSKFAEAVAEFKEAIRLNPSDAISHSDLAETLQLQGDITGATAEFREAIRLDPLYLNARHSLGIMLAGQRRLHEALAEFREAIRLRPLSARGHYNAAIVLANLDDDEGSARAWREAVRLNPNNYNAHFNFGEILRLLGELEESGKAFAEYVARAPDSPSTEKNKERARAYMEAFKDP